VPITADRAVIGTATGGMTFYRLPQAKQVTP
jgi:hypothetical protein